MGNEAIALGALRAGLRFASGYPGTPSSEILEALAKEGREGVYAEWSVNEKTALEAAAGAAMAGARALVTMKQVGLNVASDPLMSLNYVGVKGGMVIVAADDPGPLSSQTEQDTRHFGQFAKLPVFDPSSPEEAYLMIADAFELSEKIHRPVLFRPTTRVCHGYASVELLPDLPQKAPEGFTKDGGAWVIFPRLAYENHLLIEDGLEALADEWSAYRFNALSGGGRASKKGIAAGGVSFAHAAEALEGTAQSGAECRLLKVATYPIAERMALDFLAGLKEVLVAEELDPVIELELLRLCGKHGLKVKIRGKGDQTMPRAGENSAAGVKKAIFAFLGLKEEPAEVLNDEAPVLPVRPPVLCAGCPHRGSFFAVKEACKGKKAVFSGDIGCYTLGNAAPLNMVDTCLCMGAGLAQAQGLAKIEPEVAHFAFIGDSTFFHTGMPGVLNAVYNGADVILCVLDNSTTAMTGGQPHPGTGKTLMGKPAAQADIYGVLQALGVRSIRRVNPFDLSAAKAAVREALQESGVRALLFEGPCIALAKKKPALLVLEGCVACGRCARELGCPAIAWEKGQKAGIDPLLCTGCGLCAGLCPAGAIAEGGQNHA
ncbi:MAG: indolepyruvate ferredoxin oxidoreductase subunit alpha [Christensenellaceae bacterium]|jgi:indolepyruvate ferredoxin oxidoreductase alpha subunit|nr:indolepyruvate ferredoxin oxidoreductase subunit alpha [Christensenellaceae bacterium]